MTDKPNTPGRKNFAQIAQLKAPSPGPCTGGRDLETPLRQDPIRGNHLRRYRAWHGGVLGNHSTIEGVMPHTDAEQCRQLWAAVLDLGIRESISVRNIKNVGADPHARKVTVLTIRDQARWWIKSNATDIRSFRWVCDALNLDYQRVRKEAIARWK